MKQIIFWTLGLFTIAVGFTIVIESQTKRMRALKQIEVYSDSVDYYERLYDTCKARRIRFMVCRECGYADSVVKYYEASQLATRCADIYRGKCRGAIEVYEIVYPGK